MSAVRPAVGPALIAQADEQALPGASPQTKVARVLALLGGMENIVRPGDTVLLKPNLVEYHRDKVINTNPNVVAACGCGSSFRVAEEETVSAV